MLGSRFNVKCPASQVNEARQGELAALAVRKYLDALCVYFWAATSLLTSILTFSLFVLLGHALTAEVVFTSLALFGVLIAPLNSFPWVINGCVEAVVSVRRLERCSQALPPSLSVELPATGDSHNELNVTEKGITCNRISTAHCRVGRGLAIYVAWEHQFSPHARVE